MFVIKLGRAHPLQKVMRALLKSARRSRRRRSMMKDFVFFVVLVVTVVFATFTVDRVRGQPQEIQNDGVVVVSAPLLNVDELNLNDNNYANAVDVKSREELIEEMLGKCEEKGGSGPFDGSRTDRKLDNARATMSRADRYADGSVRVSRDASEMHVDLKVARVQANLKVYGNIIFEGDARMESLTLGNGKDTLEEIERLEREVAELTQLVEELEGNHELSDENFAEAIERCLTINNGKFARDGACSALHYGRNIGQWNVEKVTNFTRAFANRVSFNGNISNWNMTNAVSMDEMFKGASSFDQDVSKWRYASTPIYTNIFQGALAFKRKYLCANDTDTPSDLSLCTEIHTDWVLPSPPPSPPPNPPPPSPPPSPNPPPNPPIFLTNMLEDTGATIYASDAVAGDNFGRSVSLYGDTALIGAWKDDDQGDGSGSVYVFTRSGGTWNEETKIYPSDPATST